MLALPAQPRRRGERLLQNRGTVDEHAVIVRSAGSADAVREPLEPATEQLVVVAAERITRDVGLLAVGEHGMRRRRAGRQVIHSHRNDARGPREQVGRPRPLAAVPGHVAELAMQTAGNPVVESPLGVGQRGPGDADLLKAKLSTPGPDLRGELLEVHGDVLTRCLE